jgi:uncharacterized protein YgiM (DUF1202 family)
MTGMTHYDSTTPREGKTTAKLLNMRSGPGKMHPVVTVLPKDTKLSVLGSLRGWLIVLTPNDTVGMVSEEFVALNETVDDTSEGSDLEEDVPAFLPLVLGIPDDERLFLLINDYRLNNGLNPYRRDKRLNEAARIKAEDMVENNYFGHNSQIYGTPFNMLKSLGVFYKTASQNLVRTANVDEAFEKMMESWAHRANLVSTRYTNMGTATIDSPEEPGEKYIVMLFTEE